MKRLSRNSEQSQFLIGKVEPWFKSYDAGIVAKAEFMASQFLIGKVERKS